MPKIVEVIGVANSGAYDGAVSSMTRAKIVRISVLNGGLIDSRWSVLPQATTRHHRHDRDIADEVCRLLPLTTSRR
jgi:hypothetical protein